MNKSAIKITLAAIPVSLLLMCGTAIASEADTLAEQAASMGFENISISTGPVEATDAYAAAPDGKPDGDETAERKNCEDQGFSNSCKGITGGKNCLQALYDLCHPKPPAKAPKTVCGDFTTNDKPPEEGTLTVDCPRANVEKTSLSTTVEAF